MEPSCLKRWGDFRSRGSLVSRGPGDRKPRPEEGGGRSHWSGPKGAVSGHRISASLVGHFSQACASFAPGEYRIQEKGGGFPVTNYSWPKWLES